MDIKYLALIIILIAFTTSAFFYHRQNKNYSISKNGKIKSNKTFLLFYRYLQVSTLFFSISSLFSKNILLMKLFSNSFFTVVGLCFILGGLVLFITAMLALGKQYSPCYDSYLPAKLITNGVYKYIRHPIYTANILLLFGIFLTAGSAWLLLNMLILAYYYYQAVVYEERALQDEFSNYGCYQLTTGMFLPKVTFHVSQSQR